MHSDNQMSENQYLDADAEDTVSPDEQCPNCHERRMDWLTNRDGIITCESCGHVYDLEPDREGRPDAITA